MSGKKGIASRMGLAIIMFLLLLLVINYAGAGLFADLTGNMVPKITSNTDTLTLLWTTLFTVTMIQGFVVFAGLLGANLQFTPVKDHHSHTEEEEAKE